MIRFFRGLATLVLMGMVAACNGFPTAVSRTPTQAPTDIATLAPTPTFDSAGIRKIDPPYPINAFKLLDQNEEPFTLEDLTGSYFVMGFGYTHCPDVCPVNLANYTMIKRELGEREANVRFVFVSVDGERDTPPVLKAYLKSFDPAFFGLSGPDAAVRPLTMDFGVRYQATKPEGTQAEYLVEHTASTFLVNPDGRLIRIYSYGMAPAAIAADILEILGAP